MASGESQKAFITGGSRGIGAETAVVFAENGWDVAIGATRESRDMHKTLERLADNGVDPLIAWGDITFPDSRHRLINQVLDWAGDDLSALILNAGGGLERGKSRNYGSIINRDSQVALAEKFSRGMAPAARILFVTSHWAHWYDRGLKMPPLEIEGKDYDVVAGSKHAGETALRDMIPDFTDRDVRLLVAVSGYAPDTIVGRLGQRGAPEFVNEQEELGNAPRAREIAEFIFGMVNNPDLENGATGIIGADEETFLAIAKKETE